MKDYVNLFYTLLEKIEIWDNLDNSKKMILLSEFMNIKKKDDFFVVYFDKFEDFLIKNSFKIFSKDILNPKF